MTKTAVSATFIAGIIHNFIGEWTKITDNPSTLDLIQGVHIPLIADYVQFSIPFPLKLLQEEQ